MDDKLLWISGWLARTLSLSPSYFSLTQFLLFPSFFSHLSASLLFFYSPSASFSIILRFLTPFHPYFSPSFHHLFPRKKFLEMKFCEKFPHFKLVTFCHLFQEILTSGFLLSIFLFLSREKFKKDHSFREREKERKRECKKKRWREGKMDRMFGLFWFGFRFNLSTSSQHFFFFLFLPLLLYFSLLPLLFPSFFRSLSKSLSNSFIEWVFLQ